MGAAADPIRQPNRTTTREIFKIKQKKKTGKNNIISMNFKFIHEYKFKNN